MSSPTIHNLIKNDEAVVIDHSSIESHPDEILSTIFEFLPIINRVAIGRVSKRVARVAKDINGKVKSLMIIRDDKIPDWDFKNWVTFCSLEDHKFGGHWICSPNLENLVDIVKALPNLKALDVTSFFNDIELMAVLEQFPVNTNVEHIHFGGELRVSTLDFAIRHLQTSKVTCIWDNIKPQANKDQIANLTNLEYLKMYDPISVNHMQTLLEMKVISLDLRYDDSQEALEQFLTMLFENGSAIKELDAHVIEEHLRRVIEGGLPNIKRITFHGNVDELRDILLLPNIESVDWSESSDEPFTVNQLRNVLLARGKKMKFFKAHIPTNEDVEEFELSVFKDIAASCSNLESLELTFDSGHTAPTSKNLLELPLGQLLRRLRFLEMEFSSFELPEVYELFTRIPSLVGFRGIVQSAEINYDSTLTLERRGRRIVDTFDDSEVMPPAPQAN